MEAKHRESKYKVTAKNLKSLEELKLSYEFGETKIKHQHQLKRKTPSKHPRNPISSQEGLYLRSKGRPEIEKPL